MSPGPIFCGSVCRRWPYGNKLPLSTGSTFIDDEYSRQSVTGQHSLPTAIRPIGEKWNFWREGLISGADPKCHDQLLVEIFAASIERLQRFYITDIWPLMLLTTGTDSETAYSEWLTSSSRPLKYLLFLRRFNLSYTLVHQVRLPCQQMEQLDDLFADIHGFLKLWELCHNLIRFCKY
ncbi:hypothetical protein FIBSPDRAFT_1000336 [Athelia psychrophila]|uniref:Uncharacterized protein n=1 Tax=Athelia psychrophila TaxID=1759441 RepID=A0A166W980_9AGAM|nr:hypothetical protein FIBSPDRAFT_1000336 [Fibularhizoctonia sp. CBS 109695]